MAGKRAAALVVWAQINEARAMILGTQAVCFRSSLQILFSAAAPPDVRSVSD
jgi:hypothetical protein